MKRAFAIILSLIVLFAFASCDEAGVELKTAELEEWGTDRTDPKSWTEEGGIITLVSDESKTTAEFSRYQGRKAVTDAPLTDYWKVSSTYIVDESLKNVKDGQVSIWVNTQDSDGTVDWTIVGFSTNGEVVSWDSDGDGNWNTTDEDAIAIEDGVEIDVVLEFDSGTINEYINGNRVASYPIENAGMTKPYEVFLQIINNDQENSYSASWTIPVVEYHEINQ